MHQAETLNSALKEADEEGQKTVVLLGRESLLGSAVEFLFSPEKNWESRRTPSLGYTSCSSGKNSGPQLCWELCFVPEPVCFSLPAWLQQ